MATKTAAILLLLLLGLASCQKEFDPTGKWEESYAAYCLLNLMDTVQYVRINRVFLSPDDPALYFQNADSVNVDPAIMEVKLYALLDGLPEGDPVYFEPTDEFPKEEGAFSVEDYFVYKSAEMLEAGRSYRLVIRNIRSGFEMQAETVLLGNRTLEYSFLQTRFYNINQYSPEPIDYFGSLVSTQFEKRVLRLLYYEYHGPERQLKYLDWRSPYVKSAASVLADSAQVSDELLKYFAQNIPVDPNVKRKAVGIDKMLIINDEFTTLYIDYYNFISSGEYVPGYTNFDRGAGILASRYNYTFFAMRLKPETLDTLAYGRFTKDLGFADASGNWPPP